MKIKKLFSKTKQQQQKTLMKETKEDTNRLNDIPCSLVEYYSTQDSLQIQCNPYQITNGIFHRIFLEKKRRSKIAKAILKKESATGGIRFPDFRPNVKVTLKKWNSMVLV